MQGLRAFTAWLPDADPSFEIQVSRRTGRLVALALLAVVIAGGALRFTHLDRQIFWDDEVWTALRITGNGDDALEKLYDGRTLTVARLDTMLHARAGSVSPIIKGLATFEPQWPPLWYVLAWLWSAIFGTSPQALRALAATFGIALVPAAYRLAYELFRARAPALFAAALVALSPAEIVYAREARGYSLLILIVASSMALTLYALRTRRVAPWYAFGLFPS